MRIPNSKQVPAPRPRRRPAPRWSGFSQFPAGRVALALWFTSASISAQQSSPETLSTDATATASGAAASEAELFEYLLQQSTPAGDRPAGGPEGRGGEESASTQGGTEEEESGEPGITFEAQAVLPTADQSGVTGKTLSIPKGEATVQGMEESFSAQLSTGIATFSVPFSLPNGRGKAQPSLGLAYSSASGHDVAGVGWSLGVPFIARQTDKGIPKYEDRAEFHHEQDRFVFNGGQELVPICVVAADGEGALACPGALVGVPDLREEGTFFDEVMPEWSLGWQYFRPRVEGTFLRFFWSPDHRTWRVQDKSGVTMELGAPVGSPGVHDALEVNPSPPNAGEQIYRWHLSRQFDVYGGVDAPRNVTHYRYVQDGGMAYLSDVFWTPPAEESATAPLTDYAHHVRLRYESRTDPSGSYRSGWLIQQRWRVVGVDVTSKPFADASVARELVRRYHLEYETGAHASLLTAVRVEGRCSDTEHPTGLYEAEDLLPSTSCPRLPPMRFGYSRVQGMRADGSSSTARLTDPLGNGYEAFDERVLSLDVSPPHSLDEEQTTLMDVNSDGLPDVLVTAAGLFGGSHGVFFNGHGGRAGAFTEDRIGVFGSATAGTIKLSNFNVVPLDVDGDAAVDLLHMPLTRQYSVYSVEKRSGAWAWVGRDKAAASTLHANIDFGGDAQFIRVVDVNFDGLVDVVRSTGTELQTFFALGRHPGGDGQFGVGQRTGVTAANLSSEPVRMCLPWSGTAVNFEDKDTELADMNGDGIVDIVRLRRGEVIYWPGRGNGYWGTGNPHGCPANTSESRGELSMQNSPHYSDIQGTSLRLEDVNGDGLSDLVQVRYDEVDVWLNVDGAGWTGRHVIKGTPESPSFANRVRLTDLNGSGTSDILWGNANRYKYIDLTGGLRPHLLVSVENGLGKSTEIEFQSSAAEMLEAARAGAPWERTMPTVTQVVKRVIEKDNLRIAGRPPASYVTEYSYRDPVFEGRQREFRGFRTTEVRKRGDANSPTSVSVSQFLLGECEDEVPDDGLEPCSLPERWRDNPREALKGLPVVTETRDEQGVTLSTVHHRYTLRRLYEGLDGREVRYAFQSGTRAYLYDTGPFVPASLATDAPSMGASCDGPSTGIDCLQTVSTENALGETLALDVQTAVVQRSTVGTAVLETEAVVDAFGNQQQAISRGRVGIDEVITATTLPTLIDEPSGWSWRTEQSFTSGNEHGDLPRQSSFVVHDEHGDPIASFGEIAGSVELVRDVAEVAGQAPSKSPGLGVPELVLLGETRYDAFGNPRVALGANLRCATIDYDADYASLPVRETAYTRGCSTAGDVVTGHGEALTTQVVGYDRGFGLILDVVDLQGQPYHFVYDGFGRLTQQYTPHPAMPGALSPAPTVRIEYFLPPTAGPHHSLIHTQIQDAVELTSSEYLESWSVIDGLGRTVVTLTEDTEVPVSGDLGTESVQRWIVSGLQDWDAKGAVRRKYLEFFTTAEPSSFDFGAPPPPYYGSQRYDAFGRQLQTHDLDGTVTLKSVYHALSVDAWDAADLEPGQHQGTYFTTARDGHDRVVRTVERFRAGSILEERITESQYLPTGQPEVIRRRRGSTSEEVTRWFAYDTLGRMVLNVEPNTSPGYALAANPNLTTDHASNTAGVTAWRYRYDNAGALVGTSDARGCGANYFYDGAGRLVGEDYFGCDPSHAAYSAPGVAPAEAGFAGENNVLPPPPSTASSYGAGFEVLYTYDTYVGPQDPNAGSYTADCNPNGVSSANWALGRLTKVQDLASESVTVFDGRGRASCVTSRVLRPSEPSSAGPVSGFDSRYAPRWYAKAYAYDAADRVTVEGTGVTVLTEGGESQVEMHYSSRGVIDSITSSYGDGKLINQIRRTADNLVTLIEYGDLAATATTTTFDDRRRVASVLTARAPPAGGWPTEPSGDGTFQMVLQDEQYFYDVVNNPVEIRDHRIAEEWGAGAKPVTKKLQYDDLYRVKRISYEYSSGDDDWKSPFEAEVAGTVPNDPRRGQPSPHVAFAKRILWQSYQYDWLGNNVRTTDDANGFYDRSLGNITNGALDAGPYQLTGASNTSEGSSPDGQNRTGQLAATYDEAGHLVTLFVQRNASSGQCLGAPDCSQAFRYTWDEVGRLNRARRWDVAGNTFPSVPTSGATAAELRYHYGAGDNRVLKTAVDGTGNERHSVYVFPSLELRGAEFDTSEAPGDYERDAMTEVGYLIANGVRLARLVNEPLDSAGVTQGLRVFFELGDHLGSHSIALDKATSELVERSTYQAYGGAESSYRPEKWGAFREDYRFTGKEEDIEVGLVYFGKRYLNTSLQRWVSADPLEVHSAGQADANLYAYVSGQALKNIDPLGLYECGPNVSCPTDTGAEQLESSAEAPDKADASDQVCAEGDAQCGGGTSETGVAPPPKRSNAEPAKTESEAASRSQALEYGLRSGLVAANYDQARTNSPSNYDDYTKLAENEQARLLKECGQSCEQYSGVYLAASAVVLGTVVAGAGYGLGKGGGGGKKAAGPAWGSGAAPKALPAGPPAPKQLSAPQPNVTFVDPKGNALRGPPGAKLTGSPDGRFVQVRDANDVPTGTRIDQGHKPAGHPDPRAQAPHGHVTGVTNSDGTPWLPIK